MRIFELDGYKVTVFNYLPNVDKVIEFKKKEMATIPEDERLLSAERGARPSATKNYAIKRKKDKLVNLENLLYRDNEDKYHLVECSKLSNNEQEKIIDKFINCSTLTGYEPHAVETPYSDLRPEYKKARIDYATFIDDKSKQILRQLRYFLTSDNYTKQGNRFVERMEGIININEPLYLYHLLITEQYDRLIGKDIEEQLKLFNKAEVIAEFDLEDIFTLEKKFAKVGITCDKDNCDKIIDKVKESEHVLKLINKINH